MPEQLRMEYMRDLTRAIRADKVAQVADTAQHDATNTPSGEKPEGRVAKPPNRHVRQDAAEQLLEGNTLSTGVGLPLR